MARAVVWGVGLAVVTVLAFALPRAHLVEPTPTLLLRDRHGVFLGEVGAEDAPGYGYWPVLPASDSTLVERRVPAPRTASGAPGGSPPEGAPPPDPSARRRATPPGGGSDVGTPDRALNPRIVAATLALEDRRFASHPGVDPLAVGRAIRQNVAAGRTISGASTLAMQVARLQDPGPRTLPKKVVEAVTAVLLTARYGRDAILAQYLRLAPYGNDIHGIAYAARRYLDKPVEDLSWAETAFLCALPQAPSRTNPFSTTGRARAVERARRIVDHLHADGLLTDDERALAHDELGRLRVPDKGRRPPEALHAVLRLGEELGDRADPLVDTTLDLGLQRRVAAHLSSALERFSEQGGRNGAVMVVDLDGFAVRAAVGSSGYDDTARAGAIDYTRTPRSPGSTLKPFFYALALDRGVLAPGAILDDLGRGPGAIENADGGALGPMLPRQALANSRNVPAVEILDRIGVAEGYALLRELGLHHDALPADHYGLGLAIGGLPVRMDALLQAYTALAGDGRLRPLSWREDAPAPPGPRVLSAATARLVAAWLSDPMARLPSFPRMGAAEYPFPVAVKTGTSADYRDAWTVAWSDRHLVAVWIGDPTAQPMARLGGFGAAAELAQTVLLDLHRDEAQGLSDTRFPAPEGWAARRVCPLSGGLAGEACPRAASEWFPPGGAPVEPCGVHLRVAMDVRTGAPATTATPTRFSRTETFVDLPARYAAWQARAGLPRPPAGLSAGVVGAAAVAGDPVVRVTAPRDGEHVLRDPEAPAATLALEAAVEPAVPQVLWLVDGEPFALVEAPYTARWPIEPGEHTFEARVPATPLGSRIVRITAQ